RGRVFEPPGFASFRFLTRPSSRAMMNDMASRKMCGLLCACAAVSGLIVVTWLRWPGTSAEKDFPLPPYSKSNNHNTGPDAKYIGSAACATCHPKEHRSYLLT